MSTNRGLAVLSQLLNLGFGELRHSAGSLIFDKQCYIYSMRPEGGQDRGRVWINDEMSLLPSIPELHFPPLTSVHTWKTVTLHQSGLISMWSYLSLKIRWKEKPAAFSLNQGRQTEAAKDDLLLTATRSSHEVEEIGTLAGKRGKRQLKTKIAALLCSSFQWSQKSDL